MENSKEKQIEEMAKQLYGNFGLSMPTARNVATYLTEKKGYRKASEVAREIFEEIMPILLYYQNNFVSGLQLITFIKELKKKRTEEQ